MQLQRIRKTLALSDSVAPWTIAHQAPFIRGIILARILSGCHSSSSRRSNLCLPCWQVGSLPLCLLGWCPPREYGHIELQIIPRPWDTRVATERQRERSTVLCGYIWPSNRTNKGNGGGGCVLDGTSQITQPWNGVLIPLPIDLVSLFLTTLESHLGPCRHSFSERNDRVATALSRALIVTGYRDKVKCLSSHSWLQPVSAELSSQVLSPLHCQPRPFKYYHAGFYD